MTNSNTLDKVLLCKILAYNYILVKHIDDPCMITGHHDVKFLLCRVISVHNCMYCAVVSVAQTIGKKKKINNNNNNCTLYK